ncbi:hypothetical protein TRFO_37051 [Tritrichomonas foetus]|uniref:Uncharacterized protein n=1 Tax=Tritrichomonas foetus TaxID=1144522 RepID=A0A1J4JGG8_9EUKA|nr:hypothetical protein TRFO_37051 [Tritrichomonas foetus]|eukprot:OHS96739.1 hypothetical protein TRFO_37051 [Tritrichomonas foetus]
MDSFYKTFTPKKPKRITSQNEILDEEQDDRNTEICHHLKNLFLQDKPKYDQFPDWINHIYSSGKLELAEGAEPIHPLVLLFEWAKDENCCALLFDYIIPLINDINLPKSPTFFCPNLSIIFFFLKNISYRSNPNFKDYCREYWQTFLLFHTDTFPIIPGRVFSEFPLYRIMSTHILTYLLLWLNELSLLKHDDNVSVVHGYIMELILQKQPLLAKEMGIKCLLDLINNNFQVKNLTKFIPALLIAPFPQFHIDIFRCIRSLICYLQPGDYKTELHGFLMTIQNYFIHFEYFSEFLLMMSSLIQNDLFDYYPPIYWCHLGARVFFVIFDADQEFLHNSIHFIYILLHNLLELQESQEEPHAPNYIEYFIKLIKNPTTQGSVLSLADEVIQKIFLSTETLNNFIEIINIIFQVKIEYNDIDHPLSD